VACLPSCPTLPGSTSYRLGYEALPLALYVRPGSWLRGGPLWPACAGMGCTTLSPLW
jgi:hypothetical protein